MQDKHGNTCTHDYYMYNWRWGRKSEQLEILSPSGSCEREIGECDKVRVIEFFFIIEFIRNSCPTSLKLGRNLMTPFTTHFPFLIQQTKKIAQPKRVHVRDSPQFLSNSSAAEDTTALISG